ncbi:hypothetical protein B0J13DRAFT_66158 [Dactylonectria estremocensis]|uniref:Uncharacterized protein n=1 Tax=Dactylonectria estremocensis TaxID=1079267 RepID=A0A9P9EM42_9HYPO|nr:hypothetical protein B0J13DRAFT_66158 [Dactylonectria estremocensis]
MSSSLRTVCRVLRAPSTSRVQTQALSLGVNQVRRLSTTDPDSSYARGGAVRDSIMDKLWVSPVFPPVGPVSPTLSSSTTITTFTNRDPPLGTSAFDPSAAPWWSESSPSPRQH